MSAPTVTDVRARINAVLATVPQIKTVLTGSEDEITDAMLPAVLVFSRGATRERVAQQLRHSLRDYDVLLYIQRLTSSEWNEQRAALVTAEGWLDKLPDYFAKHAPRLDLNKQPLKGVVRLEEMTDDGIARHGWKDKAVFSGIAHTLTVVTQR